jgi:hypothetical protein
MEQKHKAPAVRGLAVQAEQRCAPWVQRLPGRKGESWGSRIFGRTCAARPLIAKSREDRGTASQVSWDFFRDDERAACPEIKPVRHPQQS